MEQTLVLAKNTAAEIIARINQMLVGKNFTVTFVGPEKCDPLYLWQSLKLKADGAMLVEGDGTTAIILDVSGKIEPFVFLAYVTAPSFKFEPSRVTIRHQFKKEEKPLWCIFETN